MHEGQKKQFAVLNREIRKMDAVMYHPVILGAPHVVEACKIPSIQIFLQPEIPSSYYSSCLFPPHLPFKHWFNQISHFITAQIGWIPFRNTINEQRTKMLELKKIGFFSPASSPSFLKIPKIIAASKVMVPPAPDWPNNVQVSGYLELPETDRWIPPPALERFLADGPLPLYIGFGSLTETCDEKMTKAILETVKKLSVRTIFCGSFLHLKKELLPPHLFWLESAPHDWLFPKVLAIVHHGGTGTTHASLQSGKPCLIIPFILDQFHWADKIAQLGFGPPALPKNRFSQIAFEKTLQELLTNPSYQFKASACSEIMKHENGVHCVVELLEKHCIDYHTKKQEPENSVQHQIIKKNALIKNSLILAITAVAFALLVALYRK